MTLPFGLVIIFFDGGAIAAVEVRGAFYNVLEEHALVVRFHGRVAFFAGDAAFGFFGFGEWTGVGPCGWGYWCIRSDHAAFIVVVYLACAGAGTVGG